MIKLRGGIPGSYGSSNTILLSIAILLPIKTEQDDIPKSGGEIFLTTIALSRILNISHSYKHERISHLYLYSHFLRQWVFFDMPVSWSMPSFSKCLLSSWPHWLIGLLHFLLLSFVSALYRYWISHFTWCTLCIYFLQFSGYRLIRVWVSFTV